MVQPDGKRRRFRRYEVHDLYGSLLFRVDVTVLNLSLAGMAVETNRQLKLGKVYSMRFGEGDAVLDLDGTVKWCHLVGTQAGTGGDTRTVYHAGLAFEGTLTEKSQRLLEFMQDHVILALAKRVIGRFKVKAGSAVALAARYDFEVQKLSLSGMLVKTRLLPELDSSFDMELRIAGSSLDVAGRVAFVERVGGTDADPESLLGIEFLDLDEPRIQALKAFIAEELE